MRILLIFFILCLPAKAQQSKVVACIGDSNTQRGYPGILNVGVLDIEGESLLLAMEPVCVASGSACNSQSKEPSYVLRALGRSDMEAQSAIRFSLGRNTSVEEINRVVVFYRDAVEKLRKLAPDRLG